MIGINLGKRLWMKAGSVMISVCSQRLDWKEAVEKRNAWNNLLVVWNVLAIRPIGHNHW